MMENELKELFESVKTYAEAAETSPGEEDRCLDALKQLKEFPVNFEILLSTQVGRRLRKLTKHKSNRIKALASNVVEIWKTLVVDEKMQSKKNEAPDISDIIKAGPDSIKNILRTNSVLADTNSMAKKVQIAHKIAPAVKDDVHVRKKVKVENTTPEAPKATNPTAPPKLIDLVHCNDPLRDKVRGILAEALCKVTDEVDGYLKDRVGESDPHRVAVSVETALFDRWGNSNGAQKAKYRSILFNIRDPNNPDFRRKVLLGDIGPRVIADLTSEEMASDARQGQNEQIKQKALFNSERVGVQQASTDQFTCGRCKKKETTYYQMQTRSADEPMTTYVTCVNTNGGSSADAISASILVVVQWY